MKILVLRGGAIGDFILTVPALGALRERWPGCAVELAVNGRVAALALACGLAGSARSLDEAEMAGLFSAAGPSEALGGWLRGFDLVVAFLHDPAGTVERHLRAHARGWVVVHSPLVSRGGGVHAADHLAAGLKPLGIRVGEAAPRLELPEARRRAGRERLASLGRAVVAVHSGSGSPGKNWPGDRFGALVARLAGSGVWRPLAIVGEAERERGVDLPDGVAVHEAADLLETAETLSACAGYVGNDSGVTHLAAALGVPVVAIFGPTDPAVWGPRGARVRIVKARGRNPAEVSVEDVWRAFCELQGGARAGQ